jgi:hypothetical protein
VSPCREPARLAPGTKALPVLPVDWADGAAPTRCERNQRDTPPWMQEHWVRLRERRLGCKWSLVQIQSPRPSEGPGVPDESQRLRGLRFCPRSRERLRPGLLHRARRPRAEPPLHRGLARWVVRGRDRDPRRRGVRSGASRGHRGTGSHTLPSPSRIEPAPTPLGNSLTRAGAASACNRGSAP